MARTAPYGTWTSVVKPKYISQQFTSIVDVIVDPLEGNIYHIECRPHEGNRCALVDSVTKLEVTWDAFDIQTHVNSYGGAAAAVHKGIVYFNNWRDHRVYMQHLPSKEAVPLTPAHAPYRFAYFVTHPIQKHIVFTVVEDHTDPSPDGIRTSLAYIDTRRATLHRLLSGADFYISPLVSPAGNKIAWLEWNHPHMPWQGAQLCLGELTFSEGQMSLHNKHVIDGVPGTYAIHEFHWISNLCIVFMSDKNRYIEPFVYQLANARRNASLQGVFGEENSLHSDFAEPAWLLGDSHYALLDDSDQNICVTIKEGRSYLNYINVETRELDQMDSPYLEISRLRRVDDNNLVFIGASALHSPSVIQVTFDREWRPPAPKFKVLAGPNEPFLDKVFKAEPQTIKIPKVNGKWTYAHWYAPTNPDFICDGEKPPCIVSLHPEPISRTQLGFQWHRTYYTSHGFGWLDIDCTGSTGYGKDYRKRLDGNYGIADIEDILDATEYCALDHRFDRNRVCLRATGQGAYLALQIMADYPESFRAAAVHNMIADMSRMPRSSSKLTRNHLRHLMGGRPEQIPDTYARRNPLNRIHYIQRPFFISHIKSGPTFYQAQQVLDIILDKGGQVKHAFFDDGEQEHAVMYEAMYKEEMSFVHYCLVTLMGRVGPTVYDPITRQTSYLPPSPNPNPNPSHR